MGHAYSLNQPWDKPPVVSDELDFNYDAFQLLFMIKSIGNNTIIECIPTNISRGGSIVTEITQKRSNVEWKSLDQHC